ncbi:MAG TPA: hypothetical protein VGN72_10705 [Tepidisphaeraceae bacterium]|jgi:hypothetical protein|nr:hypothetical protein [Tepidisphaeraceae bacterium]
MPVDAMYDQFTPTERLSLLLEAMAREDWPEARKLRATCPDKTYRMGDLAFHEPREFIWDLATIAAADLRVMYGKIRMMQSFNEVLPFLTDQHAMAAELSFMDGWRLGNDMPELPRPDVDRDGVEGHDAVQPAVDGFYPEQDDDDDNDEDDDADRVPGREPTVEEMEVIDRWKAPQRWVAVAQRRITGLYVPVIRRVTGDALGVWAAWDAFCQAKVGVDGDTAMRAHCPPVAELVKELTATYPEVRAREDKQAEYAADLERAWGKRFG